MSFWDGFFTYYVTNLMKTILLCPASKAIKKRSQRRKHCALAVVLKAEPKNFISPHRRPPSRWHGTARIQSAGNGHYMYLQTQFGEDRCTQFRVIVVTDPQTNPQRPPARCKQTGPITIHCAAKFSAQCDDVERRNDVTDDAQHRDGDAVLLLQRRKCAVGGGGTWKTLKSSSSVANFNGARRLRQRDVTTERRRLQNEFVIMFG